MRLILIIATLALVSPAAQAQFRPAPDTPGVDEEFEASQLPDTQLVDALRVMAVTAGIIGGFVAADIISGGTLTAPLLAGGRAIPGLGLRPVIATQAPPAAAAASLSELRRALGSTLAGSAGHP